MKHLRIIQVFNRYLHPGGEEKSVARIARDLETAGYSLKRFWRSSEEWIGPNSPAKFQQPFLIWNNPSVLQELKALHEQENADVWILHNVLPVVSLGVYALARELNVPIIQWLHNYRPISPSGTLSIGDKLLSPEDRWVWLKETLAGTWHGRLMTGWLSWGFYKTRARGDFSSVKAWVAVSDEVRNIFLRAGWDAEQTFSLRHSWDIEPPPVNNSDQGYFLFLGRMVESKGVRFLAELWRNPALHKYRLVMAGAGPLMEELRHHSPPNVQWIGHVEGNQKRNWIANCRAVVFPAIWPEPLSTVVYEAYQLRKPVLATNLGGMKEIIFPGKTGLLLPAKGNDAWIDALTHLTAEDSATLGTAGRRWLEQNVGAKAWNSTFDNILRRILPSVATKE